MFSYLALGSSRYLGKTCSIPLKCIEREKNHQISNLMQSSFPGVVNPTNSKIIIRSSKNICLNLKAIY